METLFLNRKKKKKKNWIISKCFMSWFAMRDGTSLTWGTGAEGAELCSQTLFIHISLVLDFQTNKLILYAVFVLGLTLFGHRLLYLWRFKDCPGGPELKGTSGHTSFSRRHLTPVSPSDVWGKRLKMYNVGQEAEVLSWTKLYLQMVQK